MSRMMDRAHEHYLPGVPKAITPITSTIMDGMHAAVRDYPDRIAIDFLGKEFTYAQIYQDIQKAVTVLAMCGVRKGDVVSLILPNCPQHYVAFYAIDALGAIASEHNPLAPQEQLMEQLERVGAKVVIAWEKTLETLAASGLHGFTFLAVDLTKALPKKSQFLLKLPFKAAQAQRDKLRGTVPPGVHSWDNQVNHADPMNIHSMPGPDVDDVAVLLQTGGTTGTPKSVALTHKNVVANAIQNMHWLAAFERGHETVGAVLPFFHAFGFQLCLSLCVQLAATQVMLPSFDVEMLLAAHKRHPLSFFVGVPPMFSRILDKVERSGDDIRAIHYSVSGAMALDPELARRWESKTGGYVIEGYGMTEASPVISGSPFSPDRRPSTLGLPFPSTEVKIVNPDDISQEYEDGEVGEILVRGPQVFSGYFDDTEENNQVLTPDGFLRTGDLASWNDGFLVMASRRKEMIINGGFNIYPTQVEDVLREMPGVCDVAIVGMPAEGSRGEAVVAALVLEPGANVDLASVRAWAEKRISHYALPKSIAIFDELPRSMIGKTLRRTVKERLSTWELNSGVWQEKLSSVRVAATERAAEKVETIKDKAEEWRERAGELIEKADGAKEKLAQQSADIRAKMFSRIYSDAPASPTGEPSPEDAIESATTDAPAPHQPSADQ